MAHDIQNMRDVALKILASGDVKGHECNIQDEILKVVRDTSHLVTYIATFYIYNKDYNTYHRVVVYPLRGPSVGSLRVREISMATRMSAAKQLLEALKSLHSGGFVHRDLNPNNIMWGISPLENLSTNAKYKLLGRPKKIAIPYKLPKQGELVATMDVPKQLRTENFYLADFGLAFKLGTSASLTPKGWPPLEFCSPERLHNATPSLACDMWSYMCLFTSLYFVHPPFFNSARGGVVSSIVDVLGPLPERWNGHYFDGERGDDSWYNQSRKPHPLCTLDALITSRRPDAGPIERKHVLSIMSRVFSYSPESRPTATQLLQDPSFQAIMDKYIH